MIQKLFRLIPPFKGKNRLANVLFKKNISNLKEQIVRGKYGIIYLLPNIYESIGYHIFVNGIYESSLSKYLIKKLPKNGVFVDLGINIGSISIPLAVSRKDCRIFGIEASSRMHQYLQENIRLNDIKNITSYHRAVSDTDNSLVKFYAPNEKYGKGSLSPVFTDVAEEVQTITLDYFLKSLNINRVNILKVDVEGYELQVFKGAVNTLTADNAPDIIFEFVDWCELKANCTPGDAQKFLIGLGYNIYDFDNLQKGILKDPLCSGSTNLLATKQLF